MQVNRKYKGTPSGASLTLSVQYNVADIKTALLRVNKEQQDGSIGVSMNDLIKLLFDNATDSHMPQEPRQYIAEWMARRAVKEGFVFKANEYLGIISTDEDIYLIDAGNVRSKMRGVTKKKKLI